MKIAIKVIIALLLFGCLLKVPYGYFQFIRIASCVLFIWLAYTANEEKKPILVILSIGLAILLNPIFKVHFTREVWNIIDVIIGVGLLLWAAAESLQKKKPII